MLCALLAVGLLAVCGHGLEPVGCKHSTTSTTTTSATTTATTTSTDRPSPTSIAVYFQYGQHKNLDLILPCLENIALAKSFLADDGAGTGAGVGAGAGAGAGANGCPGNDSPSPSISLDMYVSTGASVSVGARARTEGLIRDMRGIDTYYSASHSNEGLDVGPFLKQLSSSVSRGKAYDVVFKIHTKVIIIIVS
jgi:hypothetical protein